MTRAQMTTLNSLVTSAEGGGYTLPEEVLTAYRAVVATRQVQMPKPQLMDAHQAAARLVADLTAGESPDLIALGREVHDTVTAGQAYDQAQRILAVAVEQVGDRAVAVATDLNETIIRDHLEPALADTYTQAKAAAHDLSGHSLDAHALLQAPPRVRNAYLKLPALSARRTAILNARRLANQLAGRAPQYDVSGLFATFRNPMFFQPGWAPPMQIQPLPFPDDPIDVLLWIVTDHVAEAEPWLPSVTEQDEAWLDQFGEARNKRHAANAHARAVAGV